MRNPYLKKKAPRYWFEDKAFCGYLNQYPGRNGGYKLVYKTSRRRQAMWYFWKRNGFVPYYLDKLTKKQLSKLYKR